MCRPLTLHHTDHGYVSWCNHCEHISVAFGNVLMTILPSQAGCFITLLSHDIQHYRNKISENEKAFIYNSDSNSVRLILNFKEIENLYALLYPSLLLYEAQQILYGE